MKKWIILMALCAMVLCLATGCSVVTPADAEQSVDIQVDVEITDKLFIGQINDIYENSADYMGKMIRMEGILLSYMYDPTNEMVSIVYRIGPGCCGNDGNVGLEVRLKDSMELPENNAWVEAIGVLEKYTEEGQTYFRLALESLREMEKRGQEIVTQ